MDMAFVDNSALTTTFSSNLTNISSDAANVLYNVTSEKYTAVTENALPSLNSTSGSTGCTTTVDPFDEFGPPEGVEYIFVPLGIMVFVIILSAMVLVVSRKRRLERLRHRLMPLYNFDPGEEGEDDWETELLDESFDGCQKRGYRSMDSEENAELFGRH